MSLLKLSLIVIFCHVLTIGGMLAFSKPTPPKVRPKSLKVITLKEKPQPLLTQAATFETPKPAPPAEPLKEEPPSSPPQKLPEPVKPEPINLNFGLSSSDSKEFTQQILGFSDEVNGQRPFASPKSTRGASKLPEDEGEKPKVQVIKETPSPKPIKPEAKPTPKKTEPKPTAQKEKAPPKNPPKANGSLEKQTQLRKLMEESLQTLSKKPSSTPTPAASKSKPLGPLASEMLAFETTYVDELTSYLQMLLILPEKGEVRLKLTLQKNGRLEKLTILDASSQSNKSYVEKEMAKLTFPPFDKTLRTQDKHTFSITLKS